MILPSSVTSATPLTTTQCSARRLWLCRLSLPPGLTVRRLARKRSPRSMSRLQAELGAEALAAVDVLVAAPRAMHHGMLGGGAMLAVRHALHDVLQAREVVTMAN